MADKINYRPMEAGEEKDVHKHRLPNCLYLLELAEQLLKDDMQNTST